jgi:hypothetical protein
VIPIYISGQMTIEMTVVLSENEMIFQCFVRSIRQSSKPPVANHLLRCTQALMLCPISGPCGHAHNAKFAVGKHDVTINFFFQS